MSLKRKKNKSSYSFTENMGFMFRIAMEIDRSLLLFCLFLIPVNVLQPLLGTYLSRYVIMLISNRSTAVQFIAGIAAFIVGMFALHYLNNIFRAKIKWKSFNNRFAYMNICGEKVMETDYENIENPDGQMKMQKAFNSLTSLNGGTQMVFEHCVALFTNTVGLMTYSVLIIQLNPWIVAILLIMSLLSYGMNRTNQKWNHENKNNWVPIERKISYISNKAGDFKIAKDIRLYHMEDWFTNLFDRLLKERLMWNVKEERRNFVIDLVTAVFALIRDGAAYGILIYQIFCYSMTAADFVFYFALVTQYSNWLFSLISAYNELQITSLNFRDVREFLDIPDRLVYNSEENVSKADSMDIEIKNLRFCYAGSDNDTITKLNIHIRHGEKIAIVGPNGAGKTTFVKLLCGLYTPSSGSIHINGIPISKFGKEDYFNLFSVVFQDIYLLPVSIAKNIALCDEEQIDRKLLEEALKQSGLYDKVQGLPKKEHTLLMKSMYEEAVDLSGGEKQKLVLARALYKNGSIIILDEPTAALDPVAENELYLKYSELTEGRTSIFISHRLSSTRFCDRILYIENGEIMEEGTHEQLMEMQGKYYAMFEIQSRYYKKGESNA